MTAGNRDKGTERVPPRKRIPAPARPAAAMTRSATDPRRVRSAARNFADAARGLAATSASSGSCAPRVSSRSSGSVPGGATGRPEIGRAHV